jgi:hypothetical protein
MISIKTVFDPQKFLRDTIGRDKIQSTKAAFEAAKKTQKQTANYLKSSQRKNRGIVNKEGVHFFSVIESEQIKVQYGKDGYHIGFGDIDRLDRLVTNKGFAYWRAVEFGMKRSVPTPVLWKRGGVFVPSGRKTKGDVAVGFSSLVKIPPSRFTTHSPFSQAFDKNAYSNIVSALRKYM